MRARRIVPCLLAVAGLVIVGVDTHALASSAPPAIGKMSLTNNESMMVGCGGSLSWSQTDGKSGVATCAPSTPTSTTTTTTTSTTTVAPTTTTTTEPTTTSTTVPSTTTTTVPVAAGCPQFLTAPLSPQAFCDTLGSSDPTAGTRSGDLDGALWGVSRATSLDNQTQQEFYDWAASTQHQCGTNAVVAPESDVNMCDGSLVESANDADNQTILGMYPRQPFNFAGRTGTIEFDVSDNTVGGHGAWPSLVIADQPVPAPYNNTLSAVSDQARNSVGIDFNSLEDENEGCLTANVWETVNYQTVMPGTNTDGCVSTSSGPGVLNHVEVQINATSVLVYMSQPGDPGSTELIADSEFTVPLSQGVVWLEDVHYNGNKYCASAGQCQQTNTFTWANLAFDGPVEPRDLGFDVLDNTTPGGTAPNGLPMTNLGYGIYGSGRGPATLQVTTATGPTAADISAASGALFALTYYPLSAQTLTYSVNGNPPLQFDWPYGDSGTYASESVALPVPLADIVPGPNTVTLSRSDTGNGVDVANMDLILQGAGGIVAPG
jgi:hypothetical protein